MICAAAEAQQVRVYEVNQLSPVRNAPIMCAIRGINIGHFS